MRRLFNAAARSGSGVVMKHLKGLRGGPSKLDVAPIQRPGAFGEAYP
jgi:hypothetical protein